MEILPITLTNLLRSKESMITELAEHSELQREAFGADPGDGWHDNQAIEANSHMAAKLARFQRIKTLLLRVVVIKEFPENSEEVKLYTNVRLRISDSDETTIEDFIVVSSTDAEFSRSNIPNALDINSPLGNAIRNKRVGDIFQFSANHNKVSGKILGISKPNITLT